MNKDFEPSIGIHILEPLKIIVCQIVVSTMLSHMSKTFRFDSSQFDKFYELHFSNQTPNPPPLMVWSSEKRF